MKAKWYLAIVATLASFALSGRAAEPSATGAPAATATPPEFKNLSDLKWDKIYLI
jgi:hypothetical protein